MATSMQDLPDHVIESVVLRLDSAPCLVRAAAACRSWRRLVADAGFLARFRSLHDVDPYLGDYLIYEDSTFFAPASSSAAQLGVDFYLDFLPDSQSWDLVDSHGPLLLLAKNGPCRRLCCSWELGYPCSCFYDLIVYEPITRRYRGITWPRCMDSLAVFLLDGENPDRSTSMSNFRVIAVAADDSATLAYVFFSGRDENWRYRERYSVVNRSRYFYSDNYVGRANGSIYWDIGAGVLALDGTTAMFSVVMFPEEIWGSGDEKKKTFRVIGGEDSALRVVRLIDNDLKVFVRHPSCNDDEWVLEKLLGLPEATMGLPGRLPSMFREEAMIVVANDRYITVTPRDNTWRPWSVTVYLGTMLVKSEHKRNEYIDGKVYPCELPWPPAFGHAISSE